MRKVICIKELILDSYDDYGCWNKNKQVEVLEGSVWRIDDSVSRVIGGDIRLLGENSDLLWIEVSIKTFKEYFKSI